MTWWPSTEDIVTAVLALLFMFAGMRSLYGYWPWQRRPPEQTMKQNVETVFREQPPPFSEPSLQPLSEADIETKDQKPS